MSIKLILCAADIEDGNSMTVAAYAQYLAVIAGARLIVLHVVEPRDALSESPLVSGIVDAATKKIVADAESAMQKFISGNFEDVSATGRIAVGAAAAEILATARDVHADAIVMGTRGKKGLERMLLGSVAAKVVKDAVCPVLTVPIVAARTP